MKLCLVLSTMALALSAATPQLTLHTRSRLARDQASAEHPVDKVVHWDPKKTALIICDMWDDHWCKSAARRVGELAGPMNAVVKQARKKGIFIIHAPSSVTQFYDGTPQRERARRAPYSATPTPLATAERWGTTWCWPDATREPALPIDDSDMGCDCRVKCTIREAWKRQNAVLKLAPEDALTDQGQETWNLLAERGIEHLIIAGVHLNMCVLGRPFAIRQQVQLGKDIVLCRDLTDTMYNPERTPNVSHFEGTDRVLQHVETYWCPTITSQDLSGRAPFRFKADPRKKRLAD